MSFRGDWANNDLAGFGIDNVGSKCGWQFGATVHRQQSVVVRKRDGDANIARHQDLRKALNNLQFG